MSRSESPHSERSTVTADAVTLEALYTEARSSALAQRTSVGWESLALLDPRRGDLSQALERTRRFGAHGLWLRPSLGSLEAEDLARLVDGVEGLRLACAPGAVDVDTALALFRDRPAQVSLDVGWDPLSMTMSADRWNEVEDGYQAAANLMAELSDGGVTVLGCSSLALHAAGGDPVDELALLAAGWLEFARRLSDAHEIDQIAAQTVFELAAGSHLLTGIAKFRAAREVLARVIVAQGVGVETARRAVLHAVTSPRTLAVRGHRNNALRATGQVTAAVLGGADRLTVLPWDDRLVEPTSGSDRLALQMQNVLRDEARFGELADPGAGSFAIDALTDQLGRQAWALLAEVEDEGGAGSSLRDGTLRRRLGLSRQRRRQQIDSQQQPVLGVTAYPDPRQAPEVLQEDREGAYAPFFDDPSVRESGKDSS